MPLSDCLQNRNASNSWRSGDGRTVNKILKMFNIYLAQSFEKLVYSAAADDGNVSLCLSLQLRARQASITELFPNIISVSF